MARLTKNRADIMWEALVLNAMNQEEMEYTLGWFYRYAPFSPHGWQLLITLTALMQSRICTSFSKQNSNTITGAMVENFFGYRLCSLDFAFLSMTGFDCFRRYFFCLNAQKGSLGYACRYFISEGACCAENTTASLHKRMSSPLDDFLVLSFNELLGLDHLWNLALTSSVEMVFRESMALLVSLYQKVPFIGSGSQRQDTIPHTMGRSMRPDSSMLSGKLL